MGGEDDWGNYLDKIVVVDTDSRIIYLGELQEVTADFLKLKDVDVHDSDETTTSKERYMMDSKRHGIRPNRKAASVRISGRVS